MRRTALAACVAAAVLAAATTAGAQTEAASWAAPQIQAVVAAGLMGPSVAGFRPQDPLTAGELAVVLAALGAPDVAAAIPDRPVTVRELDARLVAASGLAPEARTIRRVAREAGLRPTAWLGSETVARLLGLRANHPRESEGLELQLTEPVTRAEAAYSVARVIAVGGAELEAVRTAVSGLAFPELGEVRRAVLQRALRLVGSPYVWGGASEKEQRVGTELVPGGFDCSGLVWRVYKSPPLSVAREAATVLRGRTSYAMSGEVALSARVARASLQPGDVVFFGRRGLGSRPAEVGHMGLYAGNGWIVHSSRGGTTLQPMTGWYETTFAWGRNVLAEAGIDDTASTPSGGRGSPNGA